MVASTTPRVAKTQRDLEAEAGARLEQLRERCGYTNQDVVAERSRGLLKSRTYVSKLESGSNLNSARMLRGLAYAYDLSTDDIWALVHAEITVDEAFARRRPDGAPYPTQRHEAPATAQLAEVRELVQRASAALDELVAKPAPKPTKKRAG